MNLANEVSMQSLAGPSAHSTALHPSPVSPAAYIAVAGAGGFGQFCMEAYRQTGDISVAAVAESPRRSGDRGDSPRHATPPPGRDRRPGSAGREECVLREAAGPLSSR